MKRTPDIGSDWPVLLHTTRSLEDSDDSKEQVMVLKGHVQQGVIVLDEGGILPEGTEVSIVSVLGKKSDRDFLALRGSVVDFPNPFEAALPEDDWDALR